MPSRAQDGRKSRGLLRTVAGATLVVGGAAAMVVLAAASGDLVAIYIAAGAALVGGAILGVRYLAGALMTVGFIGGLCILLVFVGREGIDPPPIPGGVLAARVFGILSPVFIAAGLLILAVSMTRRGRNQGWPWLR